VQRVAAPAICPVALGVGRRIGGTPFDFRRVSVADRVVEYKDVCGVP
jgi:hypothetical protein